MAFAMFLAELHRNNMLDDPLVTPQALAEALGRTSQTIARLSTEANQDPVVASYVATNGKYLSVSTSGWVYSSALDTGTAATFVQLMPFAPA